MANIKLTTRRLIWLLVVLTSILSAESSCNTTIKASLMTTNFTAGNRIVIPKNSSYCEWKIIVDDHIYDDVYIEVFFSDFTLKKCPQCECEYIEVWGSETLLVKFCGGTRNEKIGTTQDYISVKYSSKSGLMDNQRYMYYRLYIIPDESGMTTDPPDYGRDDNQRRRNNSRRRKRGRSSGITTTAIGILLALVILVGALACGICLVHCVKPKRCSRRRRRHRQPSALQAPVTSGLPKLPHLPNYYDNEGAVPPPYLETIGTDGNPVSPPKYYENPPPYSILDTTNTLETTGETRASDRVTHT